MPKLLRALLICIAGASAVAIVQYLSYYVSVSAGNYSIYAALLLVFGLGQVVSYLFGEKIWLGAIAGAALVSMLWILNLYYIDWVRFDVLGEQRQESLWVSFTRFYSWIGAFAVMMGFFGAGLRRVLSR